MSRLLSTNQAAVELDVHPVTLRKWRMDRIGPEFIKVGRLVKYRAEAIQAFLKTQTTKTRPSRAA